MPLRAIARPPVTNKSVAASRCSTHRVATLRKSEREGLNRAPCTDGTSHRPQRERDSPTPSACPAQGTWAAPRLFIGGRAAGSPPRAARRPAPCSAASGDVVANRSVSKMMLTSRRVSDPRTHGMKLQTGDTASSSTTSPYQGGVFEVMEDQAAAGRRPSARRSRSRLVGISTSTPLLFTVARSALRDGQVPTTSRGQSGAMTLQLPRQCELLIEPVVAPCRIDIDVVAGPTRSRQSPDSEFSGSRRGPARARSRCRQWRPAFAMSDVIEHLVVGRDLRRKWRRRLWAAAQTSGPSGTSVSVRAWAVVHSTSTRERSSGSRRARGDHRSVHGSGRQANKRGDCVAGAPPWWVRRQRVEGSAVQTRRVELGAAQLQRSGHHAEQAGDRITATIIGPDATSARRRCCSPPRRPCPLRRQRRRRQRR